MGNKKSGNEAIICTIVLAAVTVLIVSISVLGGCTSTTSTYNRPTSGARITCLVSGCSRKVASSGALYCSEHTCHHPGCSNRVEEGSRYCKWHNDKKETPTTKASTKPAAKSTEKKDPYKISSYDNVDDFYDDWYDDFDGFDDAEMYWDDHH